MPHINIHEKTLANGLRVIVCPNQNSPVVTINVIYRVGSANEVPGKTGLAHLFEHLMFDNTSNGIEKQYDLYCTRAGGNNNAYTTYDHTTYYITLPSHQIDIGLWLESERMNGFSVTQEALSTQQSVVIEEIKQNVENQPYARWFAAMDQSAYDPSSSYSWNTYGSVEDVAGVTMEDAKGFFDKFYSPGNAVLCIAGDCSAEDGFAKAEEFFGNIKAVESDINQPKPDEESHRKGVHTVVEDSVPTVAVYAASHMPSVIDDALLDADLAASFLGAGKSSVLYKELVARQGIASHAGTFMDRKVTGSLMIHFAYAMDDTVSAQDLTDALEKVLASASIEAGDMKKVVNRQRTALAMEMQRCSGVADTAGYHATFLGDPEEVNRLLDKYSSRSIEDVASFISQTAKRDEWVRVDIVPKL